MITRCINDKRIFIIFAYADFKEKQKQKQYLKALTLFHARAYVIPIPHFGRMLKITYY